MARYGKTELILVDNGSTDGTWEWLSQEYQGRARLLQRSGVTISALRNLGASAATGEYVSFVDSDCLVPPDYYESMADVFATVRTDVAGCMYGLPEDVHWIEEAWTLLNCPVREGSATLLPGGSMAVWRSALEAVGGFDETLITGEDAELCQRLLDAGYRIFETRRLTLVHLRNTSSLTSFFRRQAWQSLGMFGTARSWRLDRVILMTVAQLVMTVAALGCLLADFGTIVARVSVALAIVLAVPTLTVAYRVLARGGALLPVRSLVLYTVYYYARIWGLFKIIAGTRRWV